MHAHSHAHTPVTAPTGDPPTPPNQVDAWFGRRRFISLLHRLLSGARCLYNGQRGLRTGCPSQERTEIRCNAHSHVSFVLPARTSDALTHTSIHINTHITTHSNAHHHININTRQARHTCVHTHAADTLGSPTATYFVLSPGNETKRTHLFTWTHAYHKIQTTHARTHTRTHARTHARTCWLRTHAHSRVHTPCV